MKFEMPKVLTRYKWLCKLFGGHKYRTAGVYHLKENSVNGRHFAYRYICTRCGKVKDV